MSLDGASARCLQSHTRRSMLPDAMYLEAPEDRLAGIVDDLLKRCRHASMTSARSPRLPSDLPFLMALSAAPLTFASRSVSRSDAALPLDRRGRRVLLVRAAFSHCSSSIDAWPNAGSYWRRGAAQILRRARANRKVAIEKLTALTLELRRHALEPRHLLFEPLLLGHAGFAQQVCSELAALEAERQLRELRQSQLRHPRNPHKLYRAAPAPPITKLCAPTECVQPSKNERNGSPFPELFRIIAGPVARVISPAIVC